MERILPVMISVMILALIVSDIVAAETYTKIKKLDLNGTRIGHNNILTVFMGLYFPNHEGYGETGFSPVTWKVYERNRLRLRHPLVLDRGRDIGHEGGLEVALLYTHRIDFAAMRGRHSLTKENTVSIALSGEITPVTCDASASVTLVPTAFLKLYSGFSTGTGWTIFSRKADIRIIGIGRNTLLHPFHSEPFSGAVCSGWAGVTLQFDIGAVKPGDWTHLAFFIDQKIHYQYFTGAKDNEPWVYKDDNGKNYNGFMWHQVFAIAYLMPKEPYCIDGVGFRVDTEQRITKKNASKIEDGGWGSDLFGISLSPMIRFKFRNDSSLLVQFSFENGVEYLDGTVANRHFKLRRADSSSGTYWYFNGIKFIFTSHL